MLACAPGIVPYLVSKRYDWRQCLQLSIIFNLPRIIILTIFGILIGMLGFLIAHELFKSIVQPMIYNVQIIGYGLLGIFILIFGSHMLVTSVESRENLKEEKEKMNIKSDKNICKPRHHRALVFIQNRFKNLQQKPKTLFFLWGGILSIACLGEIMLIESSFISGSLGISSNSLMSAAFLGGSGMFLFAIGASIPIIIVAVISSTISKYFQTVERLETIRTIGAMVMILIGMVFIIIMIGSLISFG